MGTRKFYFGREPREVTPHPVGDRVYLWDLACDTAEEKLKAMFQTFSCDLPLTLSSVKVHNPDKPGLKIVATFEIVMPAEAPNPDVPGINFFDVFANVEKEKLDGLDICVTADFDAVVEICVTAGAALLQHLQTTDVLKQQISEHDKRYADACDNKRQMQSEREKAKAFLKKNGAVQGLPREALGLPNQPFLPKGNKHTAWAVQLKTPESWSDLWVGWEYPDNSCDIQKDITNAKKFIESLPSLEVAIANAGWTLDKKWWSAKWESGGDQLEVDLIKIFVVTKGVEVEAYLNTLVEEKQKNVKWEKKWLGKKPILKNLKNTKRGR